MKIIIFLALASVSVCQVLNNESPPRQPPVGCTPPDSSSPDNPTESSFRCDCPYENDYADDKRCLKHALENVPILLHSSEKLICKHKRNELAKKEEYYQAVKTDLNHLLKCAGCAADIILGFEKELEKVGAALGNATGDLIKFLSEIIHGIKIAEPVLDLLCDLISGLFTSECVAKITNADIPAVTQNLRDLSCLAKENSLNVTLTIKILIDIGCVVDDALYLEDTVENAIAPVAKSLAPLLSKAVDAVTELPVVGPVVSGVLCTVTGLVNNVVNGGNNNPVVGIVKGLLG